jgi:ornithine cyclodeaminase/alanine dehydrogenase-like protein (mu-crystallin family)
MNAWEGEAVSHIGERMLLLTEGDVRKVLTMEIAIEAVEAGLRSVALTEGFVVPRARVQTDYAMLHTMAASTKTLGLMGYKCYATSKRGAHFHIALYDGKGQLLSLMHADYLGQVRTGAASGIATRLMARPEARTVGVFGSGKQARTQLLAVSKVRRMASAAVFSPNPEHRRQFAEEMSGLCGIPVEPVSQPETAARDRDIVITATTSREPVLKGEWLSPGTHINAIGSNFLGKAEIDVETIRRSATIAVDSKAQARLEAGDFIPAIESGLLQWSDIYDLPDLVVGRHKGREHAEDITLFKSVGIAIEDVAVAGRVYELAKRSGLGREIDW